MPIQWYFSRTPDWKPNGTEQWFKMSNDDRGSNPLGELIQEGIMMDEMSTPVTWDTCKGLTGHNEHDPNGLCVTLTYERHTFVWIQAGLEWDEEWAQRRVSPTADMLRFKGGVLVSLAGKKEWDYTCFPAPPAPVRSSADRIVLNPICIRRFVETTIVQTHGAYSYLESDNGHSFTTFQILANPFTLWLQRDLDTVDMADHPHFRHIIRRLGLGASFGTPMSLDRVAMTVYRPTPEALGGLTFLIDLSPGKGILWSLSNQDFGLVGGCVLGGTTRSVLPWQAIQKQLHLLGQASAAFDLTLHKTFSSFDLVDKVVTFGAWAWTDAAYVSFRDTWCNRVAPHLTPRELVAIVWDYAGVLAPSPWSNPRSKHKRSE